MSQRIIFSQHGGPEVLQLVEAAPAAPEPHQVRVRNQAIGLNFIDTYFRSGLYQPPALPSGLGVEGAGIVDAVGSAVTDFKPGDRVGYATGGLGAYGSHHLLPAANLVRLPDSISFEQAAAGLLKGMTVQYLLRQVHPVAPGDYILFYAAAGGVGSIACQWAAALGARLIGVVGSAEKAERARQLGAWATIDRSKEDIVERVRELTQGRKCRVVYDSIGKATWTQSLDCLAPRGLMVSFGNASGPVTEVNLGILAQKGSLFVTRPVLAGYADTPERLRAMAAELFEIIDQGKVRIDIARRFPLSAAAEAQTVLASGQTTGSMILLPD